MGKKNSKGGNKHRKSANKRDYSRGSRDLVVPEKGQSVATVNKPFGNGMFEVHLYADHSDVKGRVCGTFRHKRVFIRAGDIVLVSFTIFGLKSVRSCIVVDSFGSTRNVSQSFNPSFVAIPTNP